MIQLVWEVYIMLKLGWEVYIMIQLGWEGLTSRELRLVSWHMYSIYNLYYIIYIYIL